MTNLVFSVIISLITNQTCFLVNLDGDEMEMKEGHHYMAGGDWSVRGKSAVTTNAVLTVNYGGTNYYLGNLSTDPSNK